MFDNASILITGATGSFGQRCVKAILERYKPRRLVVFSRDELKQFEMQQVFNAPCMRYFLGDVRDRDRLDRAFIDVDCVIHAAALKQVPALEYNPGEAIKTNMIGAENIISCALSRGVKHVIALSTDKAAGPINLYGATKLVSDKLFIAGNNIKGDAATMFSVVRYGNVLGSRGSVVPLFQKLISEGCTSLPITDERMTRFFITLQEGVDFVLNALEIMQGGELFVPKIPSVRIVDLANAMAPTLPVKEVGIRAGEKLHEVLCPREVSHDVLEFPNHYIVKPAFAFFHERDYAMGSEGKRGKPVVDGFQYDSETNTHFLSVAEIRDLLARQHA